MAENKKPASPPLETLEDESPDKSENPSVITPGSANVQSNESSNDLARSGIFSRIRNWSHFYLFLFFILLMMAAGAVTATLIINNRESKQQKHTSLTDDQIAQLEGNVTIVGDAKQTLDIQSNTIMEGQLLVRKDVDVAGSIKVGGGLSLTSVKVGGQGSFGQLAINGTLAVSGNTTFSGATNVQKNLSVAGDATIGGTLAAAKFNITSLQVVGDLQISRHIITSGSIPTKSNGNALGNGGTASVNGSDTAGTVTINTGSSPPSGCFVTVRFGRAFTSTPHVVISPSNSFSASLNYYATRNASSFSVCTTNGPAASKTYLFDYVVIH